jgi:signal transduction histidine kinase
MDSSAMQRLLLAMLENAVKYALEGGISLRSCSREGQAIVEVHDTGMGISETDLPHIFDRFYRADETRSREAPGWGSPSGTGSQRCTKAQSKSRANLAMVRYFASICRF